ncbi:MAG: hypothetical protein N3A01_09040 [Bacteroidales bacterium]|nr:hypothetical protein [Bacteroidales bacterium]
MKAVLIIFNKVIIDQVLNILEINDIHAYTIWDTVKGKGLKGDPHMGTHTWPELNSAILTVINKEKVDTLLKMIETLDKEKPKIGIKAYVFDVINGVF